jgi:hypothetical protein
MTQTQATAEIFWTAFRALKKKDRNAVMNRLVQDEELREDLHYSIIIEERKKESIISLDEYLSQRKNK